THVQSGRDDAAKAGAAPSDERRAVAGHARNHTRPCPGRSARARHTTEVHALSVFAILTHENTLPAYKTGKLALGIVILKLGIAIPKLGIAIPSLSIAIPKLGITILRLRIAIPSLGIAIPRLRIAILRLGIAILRPGIAI